jgi:signal transduction histidine kinase
VPTAARPHAAEEARSAAASPGRTDRPPAARPRARFSLAGQFLLANLVILVVGMLALGAWVGQQIESGVLSRTAGIAALYVESFVEPHLAPLTRQTRLDEPSIAALDRLLTDSPLGDRVVALRVWSPEGEVLYSPNRALIGRRFPIEGGLARATRGEVAAALSDLSGEENEFERRRWNRLLEVYAPMRERGGSRILAVTEFYQLPAELESEIASARLSSWGVVAAVGLASYLLVAGIVKRGSDTIARQQAALQRQVAELSRLLGQNARLNERVRQAAGRTTALNEQALRRIGADLHDGPGQVLALALLRLDALRERSAGAAGLSSDRDFATVHGAVRDALTDVRTISAGLRLPHLEPLSVAAVATRAARDHERRSGTPVVLRIDRDLPAPAPLPVKIALVRSLQEALSNATRHGAGIDVAARVWVDRGALCLTVSDRGPGFVPEQAAGEATGHLGLAGMRERAEMLGGSFRLESAPGEGTRVSVCWPLVERVEEWANDFV